MPAIGNLTINDGQSTPVAHTFGVVNTTGSESRWADRSGGVPAGFILVNSRQKDPSNGARNYRMQFEVVLPTVATDPTTGKDYISRTARCNVEFVLPESSVLQERKDILAYARNLLADPVTTSVVENLEHVF
jgi:hypothetical protein